MISGPIDTSPPIRPVGAPANNPPRPTVRATTANEPRYLWPSSNNEPAETPHSQSVVNRFKSTPTQDPEYQAALAEAQAARAELTALRQRPDVTSEERVAVSLRVLDAERRLAVLEQKR